MNYATEMEMNYESDIREENRNLDCKLELCITVVLSEINYLNFKSCMYKTKFIVRSIYFSK